MPPALADDHHQLDLVIQAFGAARPYDRRSRWQHRGHAAHEKGGIVRHVIAAFLRVIDIVQSETDDLSRGSKRQSRGDAIQGFTITGIREQIFRTSKAISAGFDHRGKIGPKGWVSSREIDRLMTENAINRAAVSRLPDHKTHPTPSSLKIPSQKN